MLYLTKIRNAESEFTENEKKLLLSAGHVSELKSVFAQDGETARHQPVEYCEICPRSSARKDLLNCVWR